MKFGVVVFPGTWSDRDCGWVIDQVLGQELTYLWHKDADLKGCDCVILPGGFAYGDYLRTGAIARFAPVMEKISEFADRGGLVWGICNGFQVLLEAGLLPGAMLRNRSVKFQCEQVLVKVEQTDTPFTSACRPGQVLKMPIAHGEGNYYAEPEVIARLDRNRQIVFRYTNAQGIPTDESNPNGSLANIAGLCNEQRNVVGLMPHPERACEMALGSVDGLILFESVIKSVSQGAFSNAEASAKAVAVAR